MDPTTGEPLHVPPACGLDTCQLCELWEDGRRLGRAQTINELKCFDWDAHGYDPDHCALCYLVRQLEDAGLLTIEDDDGLWNGFELTDAQRERAKRIVLEAHFDLDVEEMEDRRERGPFRSSRTTGSNARGVPCCSLQGAARLRTPTAQRASSTWRRAPAGFRPARQSGRAA